MNAAAMRNGTASPAEYIASSAAPSVTVSRVPATDKIAPSIGPIHGVHPKANAIPISPDAPKLVTFFVGANWTLHSLFMMFKLNSPMKWNPIMMIMHPATIASIFWYCLSISPIADAPAPSAMNITENPATKHNALSSTFVRIFFLFS